MVNVEWTAQGAVRLKEPQKDLPFLVHFSFMGGMGLLPRTTRNPLAIGCVYRTPIHHGERSEKP